ncbi:MAG TPA: hypothetical protein ENK88_02990, partial [Campylobacterales bacterium]|nr:hypothetical protein [Campylobacterales bacterium]
MRREHISVISLSVVVGVSIGLTGCAGGIKLSEYSPVSLKKGQHMPSKEQLGGSGASKVIIMDLSNNNIEVAKKAQLGKSMASNINKELSENKNVKIMKRVSSSNYKEILSKEIKAAELAKEVGEDIGQADYLLTGQLSNVTFKNEFQEAHTSTDKKGKKTYYPPEIKYKSCVEGTLKVFALPDLNEVKSKSFDECSSSSEEARSPSDAKPSNGSLERKAGTEAMHAASFELKNLFTPKGYIFEMRKKDEDTTIIKTALGSKVGAKKGEEVEIYTIEDVSNPLTGETTQTDVLIGKGEISNKVTPAYSWIVVNELEDNREIKLGDYIKI